MYNDIKTDMKNDMENICKYLLKTFNTNILKKLPFIYKKAFLEISTVGYDSNDKLHNNLIFLIRNFFTYRSLYGYNIVLLGPNTFTFLYSKSNNKRFCLFGEYHNKNPICNKYLNTVSIIDYLYDTFKNSYVFIDFYIETPKRLDDIVSITLKKTHRHLLQLERQKLKTFRMHSIDIRKDILYENEIQNKKKYSNNINRNVTIFDIMWFRKFVRSTNILFDQKRYNMIIQFFKQDEISKITTNLERNLKMYFKLEKELYKSYEAEKIINFCVKQWALELARINRYELMEWPYTNIPSDQIQNFKTQHDTNSSILTPITSIFMDAYTLARIFKKFNIKEDDRLNYPDEPTNIVIYAGNFHIYNYIKFLVKELDFEIDYTTMKRGNYDSTYFSQNVYFDKNFCVSIPKNILEYF